jgi:SAM-dependent methyltransferase
MQHWEERHDDAVAHVLPFLDRVVGLRGARVLEFGAGNGAIACALAPEVRSVLGLDIAAGDIEFGRRVAAERGLGNVALEAAPFDDLIARCKQQAGEVDLFLMFAVLEHMTIDERLTVLATAREVLAPGGSIAVFESPNRLLWWDHHTSQLPFFGMLDEQLALAYAHRSERADFAAGLSAAGADAPLTLARWGRGVSQHEFELALGPLDGVIVAGGYEPELLPTRHVHREELYLARFCSTLPQPPSPAFSRYWLDLVLRFDGRPAAPLVTPWPFATDQSYGVALTPWETLHLYAEDAWLGVPTAGATELLLGVEGSAAGAEIRIETGAAAPEVVRVEPMERTQYPRVALTGAQQLTRITASPGTQLSFVGMRAGARR